MALPRWLAQFNKVATNRIAAAVPRRLSPFLILHHVGRNTGTAYAVPVAAFRTGDGIVIPPTYGPQADWVRNVLASGEFTADWRGSTRTYVRARLVDRTAAWPHLPWVVRTAMRLLRIQWFVVADSSVTDG
jgi:deazaflavin-dependent oxidoreductase (nitroreductase family)